MFGVCAPVFQTNEIEASVEVATKFTGIASAHTSIVEPAETFGNGFTTTTKLSEFEQLFASTPTTV